MPVLVLEPPELVEQLLQIAAHKKTTPEALLSAAVNQFVQNQAFVITSIQQEELPERKEFDAAFEREAENFERMLPALLQQYPNRAVAIYQGQIVESGDDILQVHNGVTARYGLIPCYVQFVAIDTPRKVRIPSAWKVR